MKNQFSYFLLKTCNNTAIVIHWNFMQKTQKIIQRMEKNAIHSAKKIKVEKNQLYLAKKYEKIK